MTEEPRMTTTEPTTTAEVPAWLNLDALVESDLIESVAIVVRNAKARLDEILALATAGGLWIETFDDAVKDKNLPDDVFAAVEDATGIGELRCLLRNISEAFDDAERGRYGSEEVQS
jgi:hypothetical protein